VLSYLRLVAAPGRIYVVGILVLIVSGYLTSFLFRFYGMISSLDRRVPINEQEVRSCRDYWGDFF
jgi:hypothetical protein